MDTPQNPLDPDACYLAMRSRDARFDGRFFIGVVSTGIYCRPVCKVRAPRRENCRFFALPALAEQSGFRPCLRCRPELAPAAQAWSVQDSSHSLAQAAARWLDLPDAWGDEAPSVAGLAARLGVSDRHLRRLFEQHWGVSPLQYLQTQRLLCAKQLLADTDLPMAQLASIAGFSSLRRFNAAFAEHYRLRPGQVRRARATPPDASADRALARVRLCWRPPLDVDALLRFLAQRSIPGVDLVDIDGASYQRTLRVGTGAQVHEGWLRIRFEVAQTQAWLEVSAGLRGVLPSVVRRARALFDLDADPEPINAALHVHFPAGDGLRVPGCVDGFELAVRAILGQQVTVAAARTLAARVATTFGASTGDGYPAGLDRFFPSAQVLGELAPEELGKLGIVRQRQGAILALAQATMDPEDPLTLHPAADPSTTLQRLCALPGIGEWTAHYIAMRALRWPDAFPAGDIALHKALGLKGQPRARAQAEAISQAWRPWRSYAVLRAWYQPAAPSPSPAADACPSPAAAPTPADHKPLSKDQP